MTDAEKELRRLAKTAAPFSNAGDWLYRILKHNYNTYDERFVAAATPVAVLTLLDRIKALEKQAADAERKGAEEMRTIAAKEACAESDWIVGGSIARRIKDLPLPGDVR